MSELEMPWGFTGDPTVDVEAAVLGALLTRRTNEATFELMASISLEPTDFHGIKNRWVFEAMQKLEQSSTPFDIISLESELEKMGRLDSVGGVAFLAALAMVTPATDAVIHYAAEIRDRSLGRRVAIAMSDISTSFQNGEKSGVELLDRVAAALSTLETTGDDDSTLCVGDIVARRMRKLEKIGEDRAAGVNALTGMPTGVKSLDAFMGGYQVGVVTLVVARPGMGKSSFINAGCDAISMAGYGAHSFSMEDSEDAVGDRLLSRWSEVPSQDIRAVNYSREDASRLVHAMARARQRAKWIVDNRSGRSAADIVRSVRLHRKKNDTAAVFVDYITLLNSPDKRMNEEQAIAANMKTFAEHAKDDGLAYICAAQLNRDLEKRADKRPTLSDLRGSGRLEEMARATIALYRGSYYKGTLPQRHVDWDCDCPEQFATCKHTPLVSTWESQAQLLVIKNNGGALGRVWAGWHGPTMRIW